MKLKELVNTTAFVLAMLYSVLFGVLTAGVFALIYWMNTNFIDDRAAAQVNQETRTLLAIHEAHGLEALAEAVRTRSSMAGLLSEHYLLVDGAGRFLAGNLRQWPGELEMNDGLVEFEHPVPHPTIATVDWDEDESYTVAARITDLPDGHRLLVGFSLYESSELREQSLAGLVIGSAITIVLALVLGGVLGRTMLRRVDAIDAALADIMAGKLGRRITVTQRHDEFGQLATRINGMLDRQENLVMTLREVARNLSNDLRTPLYRLRSRLGEMRDVGVDDRTSRSVERGIRDIDTLVIALDDLLDVTRSGDGAQLSLFEEIDLTALMQEVVEECGPRARQRGLRMSWHLGDGVRIRGIPHLLSQAFAHLLQQAVAGSSPGGSLELRLEGMKDHVDVSLHQGNPATPGAAYGVGSVAGDAVDRTTGGDRLGLSVLGAVAKLHGARLLLQNDGQARRVLLRFGR